MCGIKVGNYIWIAELFEEEVLKYTFNKTVTAMVEHLRVQMSSSPGFAKLPYQTGEASNAFKNMFF